MDFTVNSGIWGTMFGVPCIVADNFLKLATGDQLKVLLFLLRRSGRASSPEEISANTGINIETVSEAVLFWQQANVISSEGAMIPQNLMYAPAEAVLTPLDAPVPEQPAAKPEPPIRKRENLYPSDISGLMKENPEIAQLFKVAEESLGTINNAMQNSLIWMMTYLGLKSEVIIILLNYCTMIGKNHPKYIEEIAASWSEKEINTLELAQEEVGRMTESRNFTNRIMKLFEMNRRPTARQQEFIEGWRNLGLSDDLLRLAYERTIEQIDKLNFDYINKILNSWKENGLASPEAVKEAESGFRKNKKQDGKSSSDGFDADKYKVLVNNI